MSVSGTTQGIRPGVCISTNRPSSPFDGQVIYQTDTDQTLVYNGSAWVGTLMVAVFNETQSSGTAGGTFTSGSYTKRTLNTTVKNDIVGCSLSSSVITLPAGTYYLDAACPAHYVNAHKAKLRNTSDSTDTQIGTNSYSGTTASYGNFTHSFIRAYFTITASKNFEIQHQCQTTRATDGLGGNMSFGDSEIYTTVTIVKIA